MCFHSLSRNGNRWSSSHEATKASEQSVAHGATGRAGIEINVVRRGSAILDVIANGSRMVQVDVVSISEIKNPNMATHERTLTRPPNGERDLELWIQHAAGLILFEDARNYAIEQLDANLTEDARSAALKAIDDAVYGMMMVIDGVSGALKSEKHRVSLAVAVQLTDLETDETIAEVNLADGDGMCMGYHGWLEGDFGKHPPMEP